jgi:PAS domain S-box-containing protein
VKRLVQQLHNLNEDLENEIIKRQEINEQLLHSHLEMELLFEAIPFLVVYLSPEGRIRRWNPEAKKTLFSHKPVTVGQNLRRWQAFWDWEKVAAGLQQCRKTRQTVRLENVRYRRADGKDGILGLTVNPLPGDDKRLAGIILIGRDITERRQMEAQVAQSQKLEALGQLSAGIAHEINTPTQYVGDNLHFLQDAFQDLLGLFGRIKPLLAALQEGAPWEEQLQEVLQLSAEVDLEYLTAEIPRAVEQSLQGVERVAKIVRAMKEFAHPGSGDKIQVNLNQAVENAITVARNEWKYVAEIVTHLDPALPRVPCYPDGLNQVLLNLIINAAQAIAEVVGRDEERKGTITVTTRRDGEWAEIRVQDTGPGIPEHIRSKIFDPFFTTKEVGKGTGQGLAIAHNVVVEQHKGILALETEVGMGTTFIVRLPLTAPEQGGNGGKTQSAVRG